jgi:uncharacterized protein (TIGR03067 family)
MRFWSFIGLLACCIAPAAGAGGDAINKELDRLQGTWVGQSSSTEGEETPKAQLEVFRLIIKGDRWNYSIGGGKPIFEPAPKVVLNPSAKPKTLDVVSQKHKGKIVLRAIYRIEGDTLTLCFAVGKARRPKEFKSEAGSKSGITVYKRKK